MKKVLTEEKDLLVAPLRDVLITYRNNTDNALVKQVLFTRLRQKAKETFIKVGEKLSAHDIPESDIEVDVEAYDLLFTHVAQDPSLGFSAQWPSWGTLVIRLSVPATAELGYAAVSEWMHAMELAIGGEIPALQIVFTMCKRSEVTEPMEEV